MSRKRDIAKTRKERKKLKPSTIVKMVLCIIFIAACIVLLLGNQIFGDNSFFNEILEKAGEPTWVVKLIRILLILFAAYFVIQFSNIIMWISNFERTNKGKTITILISSVLKYVAAVVALILILTVLGVDTAALITSASILTLVVGLGCQSLVSDIVAGVFLLIEDDVEVGDIVHINGFRGTIKQIGLRRTIVESGAGDISIVRNSEISTLINNSARLSLIAIDVGIEYSEDLQRVEKILNDNMSNIAKAIPEIKEGPFYKGVSNLGNSSVDLKILCKCKEADRYQVERDLNRSIKLLFDEHNINIPFNQIVVNYREDSDNKK